MNPRLHALLDRLNIEPSELDCEKGRHQRAKRTLPRNSAAPPAEAHLVRVFFPEPAPLFPWSKLHQDEARM